MILVELDDELKFLRVVQNDMRDIKNDGR